MKGNFTIAAALAAFSAACAAGSVDTLGEFDSDRAPWSSLEGDALADELATSPVREAPVPFVRLGLTWDAQSATAIEYATSVDGDAWTDWRAPVVYGHEVENADGDGAYVGELLSDTPSFFYRIRAGEGTASFVGIEFLELTMAESLEDGEDTFGLEGPPLEAAAAMVNTRSAWGARAPKCTSIHSPRRFTIHHTVTPTKDTVSAAARLRNIQAYHQDVRGWCDIGYQYLVSRDGRLWEGRGASRLGSHVAGQNSGNIGVSFIGTYSTTSATSTQIASAGALIADLASRYSISISSTNIKGHRDRGQTSCPGDRLYGQIRSIISAAKGGGTPPPPTSGNTKVRGVVYASGDTSKRIAGATVRLADQSVTTQANGYFEFTGVSGTFEVTASAPGFAAKTIARAADGQETWASVSLSPASGNASLQGVVYRGANTSERVANASVSLSSGQTMTADANGYFRFDGLSSGEVAVTATSAGLSGQVSRTLEAGSLTWGSVSL